VAAANLGAAYLLVVPVGVKKRVSYKSAMITAR